MSPPLFAKHPPPVQILLGIVVPILGGLVAGVLLVVSEPVYLIYSVLAIGAGYFGGLEHVGGEEARCAATGGVLFGTFILVAKEVSGSDPKVHLPDPEVALVVITTVLGIGLGALGGRSRGKARSPKRRCRLGRFVAVAGAGIFAGAGDHDAVGLYGHGHRPVAGPVLGVDGIVLNGGVEPQPVPLVTVVERAVERLAGPAAPTTSAAPAAPAARLRLAVAVAIRIAVVSTVAGVI